MHLNTKLIFFLGAYNARCARGRVSYSQKSVFILAIQHCTPFGNWIFELLMLKHAFFMNLLLCDFSFEDSGFLFLFNIRFRYFSTRPFLIWWIHGWNWNVISFWQRLDREMTNFPEKPMIHLQSELFFLSIKHYQTYIWQ